MALAAPLAIPHLKNDEGLSLVAYPDSGGVWTICYGETLGVKKGDTATKEQCEEILQVRTLEFTAEVEQRLTPKMRKKVSPQTMNALARFAYNIGIGGFQKSKTLRYINAGQIADGCEAMKGWYTAGMLTEAQKRKIYPLEDPKKPRRRDCRDPLHNCSGMWKRRLGEVADCKAGL